MLELKEARKVTKAELRERLRNGAIMDDLFEFCEGQECWMFKAPEFEPGENILYIPDTDLNDIPIAEHPTCEEEIEEIIDQCYTGNDFIEECDGNVEKAERLFWYCDWQHPSSAQPEIEDESEALETEYGELRCAHCNELLLCDECGDMPEECPNCGSTLVYPASIGGREQ